MVHETEFRGENRTEEDTYNQNSSMVNSRDSGGDMQR